MAPRMTRRQKPIPKLTVSNQSQLPTFLEHIQELRRRLFWVVGVIFIASAAAYPFLDMILSVLTAPLGGQQLYYLTPVGGFSFSIKICLYMGILIAVPCFMYHLYRYLEPLIGNHLRQPTLLYLGAATALAVIGVLFAYFISLPGALHFLTSMELKNIQAMLTVDSYLGFVMTYLIGAALLFQIPLLLIIINRFTPLKPSKLMKVQRYVIVGSFIIAAIISPTPDIMNQLLLALPIIAMYNLGVLIVWLQNRRQQPAAVQKVEPQPSVPERSTQEVPQKPVLVAQPKQPPRALDGFVQPKVLGGVRPAGTLRPAARRGSRPIVPARSIDGFTPYQRSETLTNP